MIERYDSDDVAYDLEGDYGLDGDWWAFGVTYDSTFWFTQRSKRNGPRRLPWNWVVVYP